jgi:MFS family permease
MLTRLSPQARTLLVVCLAAGCWAFGFGLAAPSGLCSLWLQRAGCNDTLIGLNTSVYYFGILLASLFVPWMMRTWGRGCVVAGMFISAISVALFPWGVGLPGWLALRFINGLAGAMSLVPTETMVNHNAPPKQRARNFGFYAFSVALGIALGIVAGLPLFDAHPYLAFFLGGAVSMVGAVLMGWCLPHEATMPHEERGRTPLDVTKNLLSFGSAWSQGFLEGGMVAFLTTYLLFLGCTEGLVSWLLAGTMVGVIAFQVPVAWLADRLGRTAVLLSCYAVVAAGLICLPLSAGTVWLGVWLFLLGACSSAFYPLGLSLLGERVPPTCLARANAWYLALNCLGSLTGPVLMGKAMDAFGKNALFAVGEAAVLFVLLAWAGIQLHAHINRSRSMMEPHASRGQDQSLAA